MFEDFLSGKIRKDKQLSATYYFDKYLKADDTCNAALAFGHFERVLELRLKKQANHEP